MLTLVEEALCEMYIDEDGRRQGATTHFYDFGEKKAIHKIMEFKDDVVNGAYMLFRIDGSIKFNHSYVNGFKCGEQTTWRSNGVIFRSEMCSSISVLHGEAVERDRNGYVNSHCIYANGVVVERLDDSELTDEDKFELRLKYGDIGFLKHFK